MDQTAPMEKPSPSIPPWLIKTIWILHRSAYRVTRGRFGLRQPAERQWGMLRLHTIGRRTGKHRVAILGYIEDGPNLVVPAMNGWLDPEPAWWLNLQADPDATVELPNGSRRVTARSAIGEERANLWSRLVALGSAAYTDANAARRSRRAAIVVLEPQLGVQS
jgi:deazaflavin-dependent oxidoreductase (nitroreductase family)